MDDSGYTLTTDNIALLLWITGGLAGAFVIILLVDSVRGQKKRHHHRGRNDEFIRRNPIVRALKRTVSNYKALSRIFHNRQLQKVRHRHRDR